MKKYLGLFVLALFVANACAQSKGLEDLPQAKDRQCWIGYIVWRDAFVKVKAYGVDATAIDSMLPRVVSYGCISQTEKSIFVVHSFVEGQPDDFVVVPKGWIDELVRLKESNGKDKKKENEGQ